MNQPKQKPDPSPTADTSGEGNREADRQYREGAQRYAESGRVPRAAREAEEALEGDEADELEEAEEEGKSRARSTHDQRGEP